MTIRLLKPYAQRPVNAITTFPASVEAGLIAAGKATADLTGGVQYFAPRPGLVLQSKQIAVGTVALQAEEQATVTLPEGQVLLVTGAASTVGAVSRAGSSDTWAVAVGALAAIGPYAGPQRFSITCTSGAVTATVSEAVLSLNQSIITMSASAAVIDVPLTFSVAAGYTYTGVQWTADGVDISGATGASFTPQLAQAGKVIRPRLIGLSATAVSGALVQPGPPGAPTIGTLTAMNAAVSGTFTAPGSNGGAAISNYLMSVYRQSDNVLLGQANVTASPGALTGIANDIAVYCKFEAQNAAGTGPQSAASNVVTPATLPASNILYAQNVQGMMASARAASTQRVHWGYIGMSNDFGAGSQGPTSNDWGEVAFSTQSIVPRASAYINTARGGTFTRGIEVVGGFSDSSPLNPFFSLGGGAALTAKYGAAGGPSGMAVPLSGGTANTLSFPMTAAFAGQVVKIYGYTTGGVGGIVPRYSLSGANTQATTNLPASTTAAPIAGLPYYW